MNVRISLTTLFSLLAINMLRQLTAASAMLLLLMLMHIGRCNRAWLLVQGGYCAEMCR
jgi:hypothetical protein